MWGLYLIHLPVLQHSQQGWVHSLGTRKYWLVRALCMCVYVRIYGPWILRGL